MHNFICIVCPRGCHLQVDDKGNVTGNTCPRGKAYAINEIDNPMRMITSTVAVSSEEFRRIPVRTAAPIPKGRIFDVMDEIGKVRISAPVHINDVVIENVLGLGVDIIATRNIEK